MKTTIAALLLAMASAAQADYWVSRNSTGGRMVLTFNPCPVARDNPALFYMYTTAGSTGKTIEGCWTFAMDEVHVVYRDGTRYTYDPELFTKVEQRSTPGKAL